VRRRPPHESSPWPGADRSARRQRRRFPILFAEKARKLGLPVVCVGIKDEAPPELETLVDASYWTGLPGSDA